VRRLAGRGRRCAAHVGRHSIGYLALFVALGGVSYAAIPDGGGVVHGCYDSGSQVNGASPLYVIDSSSTQSCPTGRAAAAMTALNWNAQGPPGPQGPQGTTGRNGTSNPLDDGPGVLKGPQTGRAVGGGDPGATHFSGVPLVKQLVRGDFHSCHLTAPGDHPMYCTFTGNVSCPAKFPLAINGGWEFWDGVYGQSYDVTNQVKSWDGLTITELYNARLAHVRGARQGWTASLATTDYSGFSEMWFGSPPATAMLTYRVWALCGKNSAATKLGIRAAH
jgi:hypothetical protein